MILTKPDIAFILGRLSQFMKDPAVHYGIALKGLLHYLRSTVKQKLRFGLGAEAEYISQAPYAKQGQWIAQILRDLRMPKIIDKNGLTVQMYGDNQGALALVKYPHLHERSKHIDVSHHFIRELAEKRKLIIDYIPTSEMTADGLISLSKELLLKDLRFNLGIKNAVNEKNASVKGTHIVAPQFEQSPPMIMNIDTESESDHETESEADKFPSLPSAPSL
ncbi:putative effector [Erysiphe necator]|uniref:Putative effector n=1 Tax=Uncinula necator TaxID=52586 RepID=A0A0B1P203_UNCNE|nr:putative effector [Erysiphe necator]